MARSALKKTSAENPAPSPSPANLWQRLNAATGAIGALEKRGTAPKELGSFPYWRHEDLSAVLRGVLVAHGIQIVCSVIEHAVEMIRTKETMRDGTERERVTLFTRVCVEVRFVNVDVPDEQERVLSWGYGLDRQDKSVAKAETFAIKQALLKTFLISDGTVPDAEADDIPYEQADEFRSAPRDNAAKKGSPRTARKPDAPSAQTDQEPSTPEPAAPAPQSEDKDPFRAACRDAMRTIYPARGDRDRDLALREYVQACGYKDSSHMTEQGRALLVHSLARRAAVIKEFRRVRKEINKDSGLSEAELETGFQDQLAQLCEKHGRPTLFDAPVEEIQSWLNDARAVLAAREQTEKGDG